MEEKQSIKEQFIDLLKGKSDEEISQMADQAAVLMAYYRCAALEIETKFKVLNEQFSLSKERNPIESIKTRIKSFPSIREKLHRRSFPMNLDSMRDNLNDIAGVRVICSFVDDIYMLADCLLQQDDVKLIEKKDYITNPKANGYRSLHLIVEIPIYLYNEKRYMRVEVQLRTIAMESWANLEHKLRYKKELSPAQLENTEHLLNECAQICAELDHKMQTIRDIIDESDD
ncbi:MAG: GTP pyrophosphokinase family protein [Clostridiales bacterium]|nr:GTP pyrophosphokinase family protein [Clostridiales bacterium]